MLVINNTQHPESTLKKKSVAICYHFMRESVTMGESLTAHSSKDDPADICTKVIAGGAKCDKLTDYIFYFANNFSVAMTRTMKKEAKESNK